MKITIKFSIEKCLNNEEALKFIILISSNFGHSISMVLLKYGSKNLILVSFAGIGIAFIKYIIKSLITTSDFAFSSFLIMV